MRKTAYLSLGSNLGDREQNLRAAIGALGELGEVACVSSFYETEPMEYLRQPWFLNCAARLETEKMPHQLLRGVLAIEHGMGRRRGQAPPKGPRILDIDILLFAAAVVEASGLTIPHPALHQRRFVLEPLCEIAPEARHPVLQCSMRELLAALPPGAGAVRKWRAREPQQP